MKSTTNSRKYSGLKPSLLSVACMPSDEGTVAGSETRVRAAVICSNSADLAFDLNSPRFYVVLKSMFTETC